MQILAFSFVDIFRTLFIWIDRLAFGLVDNAYNLISAFASAEIFSAEMVREVMKNSYIVIFIFALFRIALLLVNSLVSPEKMVEKGTGLASIAKNVVIMFVLLIVVPLLFQESRVIQKEVVTNGYIGALFGFDVGGADAPESAGEVMKKIAISAVLFPDRRFADKSTHTATCSSAKCKDAISEYYTMMDGNYKINYDMLTHYINVTEEYEGQDVYVYDYSWLISTIVGVFLTYILLSFAIDIALRTVELAVLEILAPLFIATYIDPKSSKSGPFHNWLTTVGKTYVSLFIKLAIISLALMLISVLVDDAAQQQFDGMGSVGGFAKLLLLIGILMFAKKAPKWITDLIGIKSDDTGLGGIGKKLGNAALIGGAVTAGTAAAKKFGTQKAKNFAGNRARNTLARVGGMKEAIAENHKNKKNLGKENYERKGIWAQGRAAAKQSKADHYGENFNGLAGITAGYLAGRQNVNQDAKSLKDTLKDNYGKKNLEYQARPNVGNSPEARDKARKEAARNLNAKEMRLNGKIETKDGKRDITKSWQGYPEFRNAIGYNAMTEKQAYIKDAQNNGWTYNANDNTFTKGNEKMTFSDYKNTFSEAGQKDIKAFVAKNALEQTETLHSSLEVRASNVEKITAANNEISTMQSQKVQLATQYDLAQGQTIAQNVVNAQTVLSGLPDNPANDTPQEANDRAAAMQTIQTAKNDKDYAAYQASQQIESNIANIKSQISNLEKQNAAYDNDIVASFEDLFKFESDIKEPKDCPGAVQVAADHYVTSIGEYKKDASGNWNYQSTVNVETDSNGNRSLSGFEINKTSRQSSQQKLSSDVADYEDKAKKAHDNMKPKS